MRGCIPVSPLPSSSRRTGPLWFQLQPRWPRPPALCHHTSSLVCASRGRRRLLPGLLPHHPWLASLPLPRCVTIPCIRPLCPKPSKWLLSSWVGPDGYGCSPRSSSALLWDQQCLTSFPGCPHLRGPLRLCQPLYIVTPCPCLDSTDSSQTYLYVYFYSIYIYIIFPLL